MTPRLALGFALGLAISGTGARAQCLPTWQGTTFRDCPQILAPGIQLSTTVAGTVELTPDQKLARGYALCISRASLRENSYSACEAVIMAWEKQESVTPDYAVDRAFIEEVARGLK
jgi:hypothetical protein